MNWSNDLNITERRLLLKQESSDNLIQLNLTKSFSQNYRSNPMHLPIKLHQPNNLLDFAGNMDENLESSNTAILPFNSYNFVAKNANW